MPRIEIVLIDQPDADACGAGETAITVVAAAIGNAIFDATGARIREVPFTPDRVKSAARGPVYDSAAPNRMMKNAGNAMRWMAG